MKKEKLYQIIVYLSALVWLVNGLFCKVLNLVPRHEQIVGRILSLDYSRTLTFMIGVSEIIMAFWILFPHRRKFTVMVQIATIATMNILEFILVPDLLLWGRLNILFALLFMVLIYTNEFVLRGRPIRHA